MTKEKRKACCGSIGKIIHTLTRLEGLQDRIISVQVNGTTLFFSPFFNWNNFRAFLFVFPQRNSLSKCIGVGRGGAGEGLGAPPII